MSSGASGSRFPGNHPRCVAFAGAKLAPAFTIRHSDSVQSSGLVARSTDTQIGSSGAPGEAEEGRYRFVSEPLHEWRKEGLTDGR